MLNFQIRGAGIEYYLSGIDEDNKKKILKDISNKKVSLAQIMINKNWRTENSIYKVKAPMIKKDSELIITSIDSNDYYSDGYSFFREKLFDSSKFKVDEESKTLSEIDKKVLLIDTDLRKPQIHVRLGINNIVGLSNLITDKRKFIKARESN